ncbi:MAG TPA: hypothetical protein VGN93_31140 [Shinella sp.]|jgi:hypothetical protein|uniref:hypothetical protein n=1 Tax=Shinella sp. TaxID=1870904 RepID=UPI002E0E3127|nr:hypothetical protein [Shinella sp.]
MLSRRAFLIGTSALVVAPALPAISAAPAVTATARALKPMWAVGTPGEFDWQAIQAPSAEEAFKIWAQETAWDDEEEIEFDPECVTRVESWDHLKKVNPADWIDADMGHCCERCGYETHRDAGARVVAGQAVCESCFTFADLMAEGGENAIDELANKIADEGEEEAREGLISSGNWVHVPDELWLAAVAICQTDSACAPDIHQADRDD